jgi:hypothetical protein
MHKMWAVAVSAIVAPLLFCLSAPVALLIGAAWVASTPVLAVIGFFRRPTARSLVIHAPIAQVIGRSTLYGRQER